MPRSSRPALAFLLGGVVFSLACAQAPLYYSNQNQYFLHGLASVGVGLLREDWLAQTLDPTPAFSALVALTVHLLAPWTFHLFYGLLFGAYAAAMLGLFRVVVGEEVAARRWPAFFALFLAIHSALLRWCSYRWLGLDYPWYFQAGVAGQYVLGAMFQPSAFGVLLIAAVCLFARGQELWAIFLVAIAATLHSTYLLVGALLVLGFLATLVRERHVRRAALLGALALALVLPATLHVLVTFAPTSRATFAEAAQVLVNVRIPHHCRVDRWLDPIAGLQIAWIVLGLCLARGTRLFAALVPPFVLGVLLTLLQVATGSDTLALLFPWRVSVVLVPIATAVVLARLVAVLPFDGARVRVASGAMVVGLVGAGTWIMADRLAFHSSEEEVALMRFVERDKRTGDVYFLPVSVPDLAATTRGSLSSDFKPLPDKRKDARLIPVDLQRFRLHTGAPIFIDFKSIPYKDVEVLEWLERLRVAQFVQEQLRAGKVKEAVAELRRRGVTHLVVPATTSLAGAGLTEVYKDEFYRVYCLDAMRANTKSATVK